MKICCAALTGSGREDILLFDGEKFAVVSRPSTGRLPRLAKRFTYETRIKEGAYAGFAAGDLNSDGRPEIALVEYKGDHLEILALCDDWRPLAAMRFKVFEKKSYRRQRSASKAEAEPRELAIADVTGDGKEDLIAVIHDRIIVYPQD
jgi:hypothetical protein